MMFRVNRLNELNVNDIIQLDTVPTGIDLANYWYERRWRVVRVHDNGILVRGIHKRHPERPVGRTIILSNRMANYAYIYRVVE